MKSTMTAPLLFLLVATASAFVPSAPVGRSTTSTARPVYHYRNGPEPDPSSTASSNASREPSSEKEGMKKVFPSYGTPEPKPAWGKTGEDPTKKKGLQRVFLDWEDRGFSADGLQRQSS